MEGKATIDEAKWITNFIVDSNLQLVRTTSTEKGLCIEVFGWDEFEKAVKKKHLKDLKGKGDLLRQDAVFFPCNDIQSEHWFLGVMFLQEMYIVVLDSLRGKLIKPTVLKRVKKMVSLLVKVDQSIDINQWSFFSNRPSEIPQQDSS